MVVTKTLGSMSIVGAGVLVQGLTSIRQCIYIILSTTKGTDPLRPGFGSDIPLYIDLPPSRSVILIKKAIFEALQRWESRIKVISIQHYFRSISNPVFEINYSILNEDITDTLSFDTQNQQLHALDNELIVQAVIPRNENNFSYQINFSIDGEQVLPVPSNIGYKSISELFDWVFENWRFWGSWYLLADRIVLYLSPRAVQSINLSIDLIRAIRFDADFPVLENGKVYNVLFENSVSEIPAMPLIFNTISQVYNWVLQNWSTYAIWQLISSTTQNVSVFSDEFTSEFDSDNFYVQYKLVGISKIQNSLPVLTITQN